MKKIILFIMATVCFLQVNAQNKHVLIAMDDLSAPTITALKKSGVNEVQIVYGAFLHAAKSNVTDYKKLNNEIIRLFPKSDDKGYGMLDWEGDVPSTIMGTHKTSLNLDSCINTLVKTIQFAKKVRPNVKWGFFNLPYRRGFFDSYQKYQKGVTNIHKILSASDVIYTAFYLSSPSLKYRSDDLPNLIKLSTKYRIEFMPIIWNRYDTVDPTFRHKLVPEDYFVTLVDKLLNYKYNSKKVNGVVWWGRDSWFYRAYKTTVKEAPTFEIYQNNYNDRINRVMKNF